MNLTDVTIDRPRFLAELDKLAHFSDAPPPAVTRVLFSEPDLKARAYLKGLFAEEKLLVKEDPAGNIFARWPGCDPSLSTVATGSHTDAIPFSGRFDGTVGVVGGLAALRALRASGWRPRRGLELIHFTSEEPTRFGIGCLGSRLLSGTLAPEKASAMTDAGGCSFEKIRHEAGCAGDLANVRLPNGHYHAFVELHIEQGPILEREGIAIGAVTAIAAPAAMRVQIEGIGGHAGAVLMPDRKDALCAAAEIILAVEEAARTSGSLHSVATTGVCRVHPGAINSVPSQVTLEIDLRDIQLDVRDRVLQNIRTRIRECARRRGVEMHIEILNSDPPALASPLVVEAIEATCRELKLPCLRMVSRAYHDSLFMARISPMSMIFIPCKDGVSHRPEEFASPEDMEHGIRVLALTLAKLSTD